MKSNLKTHMRISNILMIASLLLALAGFVLGKVQEGIHPLLWAGLALSVGSVVYKMFTLKCPHCGAFLPVKYKLPQVCLRCGKSLAEEKFYEETDT